MGWFADDPNFAVKPETYEQWYDSEHGQWVSAVEFGILESLLRAERGASLLDIGCGTGHFTRLFAEGRDGLVIGLDPDRQWLRHAREHATYGEEYVAGRAESLPFPDRCFDFTVSVTALCFIRNQAQALREQIRVTRQRFVLGLLNRHSLLYLEKGSGGGRGGYRGAHWHTAKEIRTLFAGLPVSNLSLSSALALPQLGSIGRTVERHWPQRMLLGGFLVVAGDTIAPCLP